MKKRLLVLAAVLMVLGNSLFVNASENLDRFNEAIKGTWTKKTEMQNSGYEHSGLFKDEITLPHPSYILTEDSTGLVYITALEFGSSVATMGVLTFSSDEKIMVIKDTVGGFIVYRKS